MSQNSTITTVSYYSDCTKWNAYKTKTSIVTYGGFLTSHVAESLAWMLSITKCNSVETKREMAGDLMMISQRNSTFVTTIIMSLILSAVKKFANVQAK